MSSRGIALETFEADTFPYGVGAHNPRIPPDHESLPFLTGFEERLQSMGKLISPFGEKDSLTSHRRGV
jgi:hypothetical protein